MKLLVLLIYRLSHKAIKIYGEFVVIFNNSEQKKRIILKHKSSFKFKSLSTPMSNFPYYALIFLVPNTGGCCEVPVSVCAFSPQSHRNNTEISLILSQKNKGRSHHPHTRGAPEKLRNSRDIESVDPA